MPHKCMNCGEIYDDGSQELIDGCDCGSNLFMYEPEEEISEDEKQEVKNELEEMSLTSQSEKVELEFDIDSIRVQSEGVYEINISRLLDEIPLVVRKREGKYYIQLPSAFNPEEAKISSEEL